MTQSNAKQNDADTGPAQSTCGINLLDAARPDSLANSRMIGCLLGFKNREGRFVILESLLDYLANTKKLSGLEGFRIDKAPCRLEEAYHKAGCDDRWVFGSDEQWGADQCCGIFALYKTNWTAGKLLPESDAFQWAVNDRINRLLVLCLPPDDFVASHEQTWETVREEVPWEAGREVTTGQPLTPRLHRIILCPGKNGPEHKMLKAAGGQSQGEGRIEPETGAHNHLRWVEKHVLAPKVTERYVRLSYLGDVLPWLREHALPVAAADDAGLAQAVAQYIGHLARRPAVLTDDGGASARDAEINQKIELEIAFRNRLVVALDGEGYVAKDTMTGKTRNTYIRWMYEDRPNRMSAKHLRMESKDASAAFCLGVWLSSEVPAFMLNCQPLGIEGVSFFCSVRKKAWDGASWCESTLPSCYHVAIIDARLHYGDLPLPFMRDLLSDGRLAEELVSKMVSVFERIRAVHEAHLARLDTERQAGEDQRATQLKTEAGEMTRDAPLFSLLEKKSEH